jgi:hypothetical protein
MLFFFTEVVHSVRFSVKVELENDFVMFEFYVIFVMFVSFTFYTYSGADRMIYQKLLNPTQIDIRPIY